jgi:hypothetical protein
MTMGAGRSGIRIAESGPYATGRALQPVWPARVPTRPAASTLWLADRMALLRATAPNDLAFTIPVPHRGPGQGVLIAHSKRT